MQLIEQAIAIRVVIDRPDASILRESAFSDLEAFSRRRRMCVVVDKDRFRARKLSYKWRQPNIQGVCDGSSDLIRVIV